MITLAFLTVLLMLSLQTCTVYSAPKVTITQIGENWGQALGINDLGQVVGHNAIPSVGQRAFSWTAKDGITTLPILEEAYGCYAVDVNNRGQIAGCTTIEKDDPEALSAVVAYHAVMWTPKGEIVDLGAPTENYATHAYAINIKGQVACNAYPYIINIDGKWAIGTSRAYLWTAKEGFIDLGTLGGDWSTVRDVNDKGQVVGWSDTATGDIFAFIWTPKDGMQAIGAPSPYFSTGSAINNKGVTVGRTNYFGGTSAYLRTAKGEFINLETLGGSDSGANDVNSHDQVVGYSATTSEPSHAFLWTAKTGMQDLGALDASSGSTAFAINNKGEIAGQSGSGFFGYPVIWKKGR